jgi:hypothetical protein
LGDAATRDSGLEHVHDEPRLACRYLVRPHGARRSIAGPVPPRHGSERGRSCRDADIMSNGRAKSKEARGDVEHIAKSRCPRQAGSP